MGWEYDFSAHISSLATGSILDLIYHTCRRWLGENLLTVAASLFNPCGSLHPSTKNWINNLFLKATKITSLHIARGGSRSRKVAHRKPKMMSPGWKSKKDASHVCWTVPCDVCWHTFSAQTGWQFVGRNIDGTDTLCNRSIIVTKVLLDLPKCESFAFHHGRPVSAYFSDLVQVQFAHSGNPGDRFPINLLLFL